MRVITYKNKSCNLNELFTTPQEFIKFIELNLVNINVCKLDERLTKLYYQLISTELETKKAYLKYFLSTQINFNYRSCFKLGYWVERGYGLDEFNYWLSKRKNIEIATPLNIGNCNTFKFCKTKFKYEGELLCNLCKSKLEFDMLVNIYVIKKCTNDDCVTNIKQRLDWINRLAFLPYDRQLNKRLNINNKNRLEYWYIRGFNYNDTALKIYEINEQLKLVSQTTKEYHKIISELSDDEIEKKLLVPSQKNFWLNKGFTVEEAKTKISEISKKGTTSNNKKRKENPEKYKECTTTNTKYWINRGLTHEEAVIKISENQSTFSLKICVDKYGEEEGTRIFTDRQIRWKKSLASNGNLKCGYSKISQELFYEILNSYTIKNREFVMFATKNHEMRLNKRTGGIWLYDFADTQNKKIIEYNGDMFHGNPKKYKADDTPNPFNKTILASTMWENDLEKQRMSEENGYETLVIWDSDYRWGDKKEIENKCLIFLGL